MRVFILSFRGGIRECRESLTNTVCCQALFYTTQEKRKCARARQVSCKKMSDCGKLERVSVEIVAAQLLTCEVCGKTRLIPENAALPRRCANKACSKMRWNGKKRRARKAREKLSSPERISSSVKESKKKDSRNPFVNESESNRSPIAEKSSVNPETQIALLVGHGIGCKCATCESMRALTRGRRERE